MKRLDAHIHLEKYTDDEIEQFLQEPDLLHMVAVSMDLTSSKRTLEIKRRYPDRIFAACGFHPEQEAQDVQPLIRYIRQEIDQIDAIGEIGLPYYVKKNSPQVDEAILRNLLEIAAEWKKPVILHAVRKDVAQMLDFLQEYHIKRAHFHWIKTDPHTLDRLANAGCYVSFTPDIWYNDETAQIAASYPLSLMMVETDGPWQFEGPFSNQPTTPKLLEQVIERLAEIRQMDKDVLACQIIKNSYCFFGTDADKA